MFFKLLHRIGITIDDRHAGMSGSALQVAALPFRKSGKDTGIDILLITSRRSRRWVIPKGWPAKGSSLWQCAAREAYEEAGIRGTISPQELARFVTTKIRPDRAPRDIDVVVYPLEVSVELPAWPEQHQRERAWFSLAEAQALLSPELQPVLAVFAAASR